MKYIRKFATEAEYNAASADLPTPNIVLIEENMSDADGGIILNKYVEPTHNYANDYLTLVALEPIDVEITIWAPAGDPSYSLDGGESWTVLEGSNTTTTVSLDEGDKMLLKSTMSYVDSEDYNTIYVPNSGRFNLEGNGMSWIYGDNFIGQTVYPEYNGNPPFMSLFVDNHGLIDAGNLILPATTLLAEWAYSNMFAGCTSLTTAPELPATTLANNCYSNMFYNCTSLTTAPELPATTLAEGCYYSMFANCTSLTTAPELPATTLVDSCYYAMFNSCTNVNSVTCLAIDFNLEYGYTADWLYGVASTGTFTKKSGAVWESGNNGIPTGWTVVEV